jgi:signal peptidase I
MSWTVLILGIVLAGTLFLLLVRAFFFLVEVNGQSMMPTFRSGDRVIALRHWPARWLHKGQIVVWKLPYDSKSMFMPHAMGNTTYRKRIIGLPGAEVTTPIVKLPEPFEEAKQIVQEIQELRNWHIPAGHCFVKGDSPG